MTATLTARRSFLSILANTPADSQTRLVYADWLEENGHTSEARHQRFIAGQGTLEGTEVVTVARDGADCAPAGPGRAPIWTTTVYAAQRRADGLLTWRRVSSYRCDRTAGREVSGPMIARAKARAEERGCEFLAGIRHGTPCE